MWIKPFSRISVAAALFVGACVASEEEPARQPEPQLSTQAQLLRCTPNSKTCDIGCNYVGGPSTDDCIVQCNAAGNGYLLVEGCGYAQNFPYSASCLNSQPNPVCQWN